MESSGSSVGDAHLGDADGLGEGGLGVLGLDLDDAAGLDLTEKAGRLGRRAREAHEVGLQGETLLSESDPLRPGRCCSDSKVVR